MKRLLLISGFAILTLSSAFADNQVIQLAGSLSPDLKVHLELDLQATNSTCGHLGWTHEGFRWINDSVVVQGVSNVRIPNYSISTSWDPAFCSYTDGQADFLIEVGNLSTHVDLTVGGTGPANLELRQIGAIKCSTSDYALKCSGVRADGSQVDLSQAFIDLSSPSKNYHLDILTQ